MFVGGIGLQYIVKGKLLKNHRFEMNSGADGLLAQKFSLHTDVVYLPDAFIYFNYLEDGRWDAFKR